MKLQLFQNKKFVYCFVLSKYRKQQAREPVLVPWVKILRPVGIGSDILNICYYFYISFGLFLKTCTEKGISVDY